MTIEITTLPSGTSIIEVEGEVKTFATEALALSAIAVIENGAEYLRLGEAYAASKGLTGKNAKGKVNVVSDYLAWVDAGMPDADPADTADTKVEDGVADGEANDGKVDF
jgi:hypothetical protein